MDAAEETAAVSSLNAVDVYDAYVSSQQRDDGTYRKLLEKIKDAA